MEDVFLTLSGIRLRGQNGLHRLNQWTRGWLFLLGGSFREILSFESSLMAAATAYFTLFSVFPLILLTVAIASSLIDPDPFVIGSEIVERLEFAVPALSELLGANLEQIVHARGAITRLSAVTLLWSASSVFYMLTRAMDGIWQAESARPAWRHRALAILLTLAMSVVLWIGTFAWSIIVPIINSLLPDRLIQVSPYLSGLGSALLSVIVFALLYYFLPHVSLHWRDVLLGAILAGLLWEVAKRGFLIFVTNFLTLSNLVYGSVTAIIAFLVWAYVSSLIFLYGGHVNVRYKRRRLDQSKRATRK